MHVIRCLDLIDVKFPCESQPQYVSCNEAVIFVWISCCSVITLEIGTMRKIWHENVSNFRNNTLNSKETDEVVHKKKSSVCKPDSLVHPKSAPHVFSGGTFRYDMKIFILQERSDFIHDSCVAECYLAWLRDGHCILAKATLASSETKARCSKEF